MAHEINWNARAAEYKAVLDSRNGGKGFSSYDDYMWYKDAYWEAVAKAQKTTYGKVNPMGFWHPTMSN